MACFGPLISRERDAFAAIDAISIKMAAQHSAMIVKRGGATAVTYQGTLRYPWLEDAFVSTEIYAADIDACANLTGVGAPLEGALHVVQIFDFSARWTLEAAHRLGYSMVGTSRLIACEVALARSPDSGLTIEIIDDVDALRRLPDVFPEVVDVDRLSFDGVFRVVVLHGDEEALAIGQMVYSGGLIAYLSEIVVAVGQRGRGYGSELTSRLMRVASAMGAHRVVLLPSHDAEQYGFYDKMGFRRVCAIRAHVPR